MSQGRSARVLSAIERNRRRIWAVCYRMTGSAHDADDLSQEAIARAIERAAQMSSSDATGWLLRLASRVCLDHLRHQNVVRRVTDLVDPIELPPVGPDAQRSPEDASILREDLRFGVTVAMQHLSPRQRAAVILRHVCDQPLEDVAEALDTNANAIKALLHRGRAALARARRTADTDVPTDPAVVEQLSEVIRAGSIEALTELLTEEVWGVVDGGGVVPAATRPTHGRRAVSRQFRNAQRRLGKPLAAELCFVNGEAAAAVRLATDAGLVALIVPETRAGRLAVLRTIRDPRKLQPFFA